MNSEINILSTRPLPASMLEEAEQNGIRIDLISFIHTEPIAGLEEKLADLSKKQITAVFTSMNAVEALNNYNPTWKIFCIGDATQSAGRRSFTNSEIAGTAQDASQLADVIINAGVKQIYFFCGDQRRAELPGKLKSAHIPVEEIVVYKTIPTPKRIEKNYNGILFFSPSAAESFFQLNTINPYTILFAIGNTTGNTIKKFTGNAVITSDSPGKEALARHAITYFKSL